MTPEQNPPANPRQAPQQRESCDALRAGCVRTPWTAATERRRFTRGATSSPQSPAVETSAHLPSKGTADCQSHRATAGLARQRPARNLTAAMPPPQSHDVVHSEAFLRSLMRRQLSLSIACAASFLVALLGLPLLNYFAPALMATRIAGFTLSWLVLGVLFFPFVWVISFAFIRRSIALEEDEVAQVKSQPTATQGVRK